MPRDVDGMRKSSVPDFRRVKRGPQLGNIRLAGIKPVHDGGENVEQSE
jgi:hypothetical protein